MLSVLFELSASRRHNLKHQSHPVEANSCTGTVTPSVGVNVRSGPGTNYGIVTSCGCGASVTVNGRNGDWFSVNANGVNGYIRGDLLRVPGVVNSGAGLNVRSGPGTNYGIVTTLGNGASISITNIQNGWYRISNGWVCADYVSLSGSGSSPDTPSGTVIRQGNQGFNSNIRRWGCAFMSCCWCGGVNSVSGCSSLYDKAVANGWMQSTCYINDWGAMATGIGRAKSYRWASRGEYPGSGAKEILQCANSKTTMHFVVGNGNGGITYDPATPGWVSYGDCQNKRFFYY